MKTRPGKPCSRASKVVIGACLLGTLLAIIYTMWSPPPPLWHRYIIPRWNVPAAHAAIRPIPTSWPGHEAVGSQQLIIEESTRLTASQHSVTIAEVGPGEFLAAWFGGSWERFPDVAIWSSRYTEGKGWSKQPWVAAADEKDPCWNPVLVHLPVSSQTILFYKVGENPRIWRPLMRRSHDKGATWSSPEPMPSPCMGPAKNKPLVMPDGKTMISGASDEVTQEMIDHARTAWRPAQEAKGQSQADWPARLGPKRHLVGGWHSWVEVSLDGGYTWGREKDIQFQGRLIQPAVFFTEQAGLGMLLRPHNTGMVAASYSTDGVHWSPARNTTLPNPNAGLDAVGLKDGRVLAVYNPVPRGMNGTGRHELAVAMSADGGFSWRRVMTLENRPEELPVPDICCHEHSKSDRSLCTREFKRAEYSYPSVIQAHDGMVHVVYTYSYGASKPPCAGRENLKHVIIDPSAIN
mmetsp:Transcript_14876/g.41819  ORF Transcript_14876/g.41819 Transcript_14876/m.41819 type:complete len:463 (-) Transcript_14876:67-1455(-)